MPDKILVKDPTTGEETEREYYTADEVTQMAEAKAAAIQAEYESKVKELEEGSNPDWKAAREKIKSLEEANRALAEQGKKIDETGKIVDLQPKSYSLEEIEAKAREVARQEQLNLEKDRFLSQFDDETRKVIEHNYSKLTTGETVTMSNMNQFLSQAEMLSTPNRGNDVRRALSISRGGVPNKSEERDFSETDEGSAIAEAMGLKYVTRK